MQFVWIAFITNFLPIVDNWSDNELEHLTQWTRNCVINWRNCRDIHADCHIWCDDKVSAVTFQPRDQLSAVKLVCAVAEKTIEIQKRKVCLLKINVLKKLKFRNNNIFVCIIFGQENITSNQFARQRIVNTSNVNNVFQQSISSLGEKIVKKKKCQSGNCLCSENFIGFSIGRKVNEIFQRKYAFVFVIIW